jgi:hypothetical protein
MLSELGVEAPETYRGSLRRPTLQVSSMKA